MKKKISLLLTLLLLLSCVLAVPAYAENGQEPEGSTSTPSTEPSKPSETTAPSDSSDDSASKPSDPSQGTASTTPSEPKPCAHVFGEWTADEAAHGRKCTLCGHAESNAHSWAPETIIVDPTCGETGGKCKVCTVCAGVLVTELIEPTGKHSYDNACDTKCNVCGAERTVEHSFGTGWKYSGKGHWHTCTVCGAAGEVKDHYPGPAATEEKDQICLTCGMIMMKKKAHTHKWDSAFQNDDAGHWHICTTCQEKDTIVPHTYEDDCDVQCGDCGYVRTAVHTYGSQWIQTEAGHCGICTACGETGIEEAHTADSEGAFCSICGYAMELAQETHEHDFVRDGWEFDETNHWNLCICGEKGNSAPHAWDEGESTEEDITLYRCEVCGAEKQEEMEKRGSSWLSLAAGGVIVCCLVGIAVCVVMIRKNKEEYR